MAASRTKRIIDATSNIDGFKQIAGPGLDAHHVMTPWGPEECIAFQAHTFTAFELQM